MPKSKAESPPRAVVYCRVSTKEQTQNLSLPTQRRACTEYCEQNGFAVERVFVDAGESAKTADRPEFQKLLTFCRENKGRVHLVVVYNLSRFARSTHDHTLVATLLRRFGIALRSATEPTGDNASGKLMENILAAFAQFDNDAKAERTIAGMKAAIGAGRWTFAPPLGYRRSIDGSSRPNIEPDPERAPLIRAAFELYATGLHTKSDVLKLVSGRGLRTLRGKPVSPQTFQQALRNPIYAGLMRVKGWDDLPPQPGDFDAIVSPELFDRVQAVLDGKAVVVAPHLRNHPDFPLRVFVRCETCATGLTGSWSKGRTSRYPYYRCRSAACKAVNIRKADLENSFVAYLSAMTPKPEFVRLFRAIVLDVWEKKQAESRGTRQRLQRKLESLIAKKDRVVDAFLHRGVLDQRTYERQRDILDEEITLTESALHDTRLDELDVEGLLVFAEYLLSNAGRLWTEASLEQKQRLQNVLFPRGVTWSRYGGFGTAETSIIFRLLRAVPSPESRVVSPTGFEPVLPT